MKIQSNLARKCKQFIRERIRINDPNRIYMTFNFTLDAFPEYTRFNKTKKVIAAIQIVEDKDGFGKAKEAVGP